MGTKTPKEFLIEKVYSAIREFEEVTGVEVVSIKTERLNIENLGDAVKPLGLPQPCIEKWELELK